MKKFINRFKYYFTTNLLELDLKLFDFYIIVISIVWLILLTLVIPASLILSLIKN